MEKKTWIFLVLKTFAGLDRRSALRMIKFVCTWKRSTNNALGRCSVTPARTVHSCSVSVICRHNVAQIYFALVAT